MKITIFTAVKYCSILHGHVCVMSSYSASVILEAASKEAIDCELIQVQYGVEKVITFSSSTLTKEQRRYYTMRKDLLTVLPDIPKIVQFSFHSSPESSAQR